MTAAALVAALVAIVVQDGAVMRASPEVGAPQQAVLWRGEWLEVRGELDGWVQVWDPRRARPGYVADWLVRRYELDEATAPELRALVRFFRDMPGAESLGIGYVALFARAAPAAALDAELFDALGTMATRLAARASGAGGSARGDAAALPHHLEVAASYGVQLDSFTGGEEGAPVRVCYDGDAWRRVLALEQATGTQRARAALAVTDPACAAAPGVKPSDLDQARARSLELLDGVDPAALPARMGNQVRLRVVELSALRVFHLAQLGRDAEAAVAAGHALDVLARVDAGTADGPALARATVLVAATHWARSPAPAAPPAPVTLRRDGPRTCVGVVAAKAEAVAEHCSYGVVWPSSVRVLPQGRGVVVAVQPVEGWVELWVFRPHAGGWRGDPLIPAAATPQAGYVQLVDVRRDGRELVVQHDAIVDGRRRRRVEHLDTATLEVTASSR